MDVGSGAKQEQLPRGLGRGEMISDYAAVSNELATQLGLKQVAGIKDLNAENAIFDFEEQQLILHLLLDGKPDTLKFDLAQGEVALRASKVSKSNEIVAKAIGCKPHYRPRVLDATAGMGRDSLMMAMLGCTVIMQERNFAIYHLLENALIRLKNSLDFKHEVSERLSLHQQNSIESAVDNNVDVIYLDPMFPDRKKSALVKKEMRLFKLIAGDDLDSDQLLLNALENDVKRVVVKRPKGAPFLAEKKPSHEIKAKKFRYDVYGLMSGKFK